MLFFRLSIFGVLLLVGSSKAALSATILDVPQDYYRPCPLHRCKECPSEQELRAPGVGFALETGHGTAVVRLQDGTHHHISLIEGSTAYTALMRRLATGPVNRTPDHIDTSWEKFQYIKARVQRHLNKLLGRPATPETAILAGMVSALHSATQKWLGGEAVTAAVLSSPDRIALTVEELNDIFDYLKLRNLMAEPDWYQHLYTASAAYAGYGEGLCATYIDAYECEREVWVMPSQRLLHIDFSRESLSGTIKDVKGVFDGLADKAFIDPDLGHMREEIRLATAPESDGSLYWADVSYRIREFVMSFRPQITAILLTGTSATNPYFKTALRDAMNGVVGNDVIATFDSDGTENMKPMFDFATARGAAEVAKRRQEGPVRCAQTDDCKRRRERGRKPVLQVQGMLGMEV